MARGGYANRNTSAGAWKAIADVKTSINEPRTRTKSLLPFWLALGNRRNARCSILVHGDSTDEGIGAGSNDRMRTWASRMGATLRQQYTGGGGEIIDPNLVNFLPVSGPGAMANAGTVGPVVNWWGLSNNPAPGWTVVESLSGNGYALKANAAGSTLTLTVPASVITTYCIVSRRGPDATYGWTAAVTSGTAPVAPATGAVRDGVWSTLVNNSAANVITITAGGSNTVIDGATFFANNFNRGLAIFNVAKGGSRAYEWLPASRGGKDWIKDNQDPNVEAGVQGLIDMNPDLIIRGGFYNDMNLAAGRSAVQYKQDELDLIAGMRSVLPTKTIPVVLLTKWKAADTYLADATSRGRYWEDFVRVRDEIAAADPYCLHLNLTDIMPRPLSAEATNLSIGYFDNVHGSDRAYAAVSDLVANYLTAGVQ